MTYRITPDVDILAQAAEYRTSYGEWASGYDLVGAMAIKIARLREEVRTIHDECVEHLDLGAEGDQENWWECAVAEIRHRSELLAAAAPDHAAMEAIRWTDREVSGGRATGARHDPAIAERHPQGGGAAKGAEG